jgi:hypothetical protein
MMGAGRVLLSAAALIGSLAMPVPASAQSVVSSPLGLSEDGRWQLFSTKASLSPVDTNKGSDVYERDLLTGAVRLISATRSGRAANAASDNAAMSRDGNWVVFTSAATDLDGSGPACDVYVRDVQAGVTERMPRTDGIPAGSCARAASISDDGATVVFAVDTNLPNVAFWPRAAVLQWTRDDDAIERIDHDWQGHFFNWPVATTSVSPDGHEVVVTEGGGSDGRGLSAYQWSAGSHSTWTKPAEQPRAVWVTVSADQRSATLSPAAAVAWFGAARTHTPTTLRDSVAPNTTITSGPPAKTRSHKVTFMFKSNESGSVFQCRVNSGAWLGCRSGWTVPYSGKKAYRAEVRAIDRVGNVDGSPATRRYLIY